MNCTTCRHSDQIHNTEPCTSCVNFSEWEPVQNCDGCFGALFNDCENCGGIAHGKQVEKER